MISGPVQTGMKRDMTKAIMALAMFFLALSRANFGTSDYFPDVPSTNASHIDMARMSQKIRELETWEKLFEWSDNVSAMMCACCSAIMLSMTLIKRLDRVKRMMSIAMMVCLTLASLSIMLSDLSSWACGYRFKMLSSGCYITISASIYFLNMFRYYQSFDPCPTFIISFMKAQPSGPVL